jgi:hypothetical protein
MFPNGIGFSLGIKTLTRYPNLTFTLKFLKCFEGSIFGSRFGFEK